MLGRLFDSPVHLIILVLVIVVVFGWKRLPDAARSLGRSSRILKSEIDEMKSESNKSKASTETVQGEAQSTPTDTAQGATPVDDHRPDAR